MATKETFVDKGHNDLQDDPILDQLKMAAAPERQLLSLSGKQLNDAALLLDLLSNPTRLRILQFLLRQGETSVGILANSLDLRTSSLSKHLGKLRGAGVVSIRRDRQVVYYSVTHHDVIKMLSRLEEIPEFNTTKC